MGELLVLLGITSPQFEPKFVPRPGQLVIEEIDIDLVMETRQCLCISKETVYFLQKICVESL
jgi:hypothetical protein